MAEQSNERTAGLWDAFAPHRSRVTAIFEEQHRRVFTESDIHPPWAPHGTLCILGAGNSNDVNLRRLLRRFRTVELVDLDGAALERGVARQLDTSEREERVRLHGGVDLFGGDEDKDDIVMTVEVETRAANTKHADRVRARLDSRRVASTLRLLLASRCDVVGVRAPRLHFSLRLPASRYHALTVSFHARARLIRRRASTRCS